MRPFFFVHMTDPQFGYFTENADFALETLLFDKAVGDVNRLRPPFVVITGDLVHDIDDAAQVTEYHRIASKIDPSIRVYHLPGNHDIGNIPTAESLAKYREKFGPDRFWFRHEDCWFVGINSGLIHTPDHVADAERDQAEWLTDVLTTAKASQPSHIFVMMHHPPCVGSIDEPTLYFNLPVDQRKRYLELFERCGVSAVFSGHYHRNGGCDVDGLSLITTGPIGRPLGEDAPGLRIVKVYDDRIAHSYHGFGEVPDSVESI